MARMIGFRPPGEDYDYEESRRGRSSRTGRYTRMGYDDEYEGRGGTYGEGERFERRGGYRSRYDDERMGGYEGRRGGRGYRSRMEEGRRGRYDDEDDGYD